MPSDRTDDETLDLRARPASLPPRRRLIDPAAALLMATLIVCLVTAIALYAVGH